MRGQPVHEEYRLFCLHGKVLAFTPFADQTEFVRQRLHWENLASHFTIRFIMIDVARQVDGSWIVVEVGDAGVAGLPLSLEPALSTSCSGRRWLINLLGRLGGIGNPHRQHDRDKQQEPAKLEKCADIP